MDILSSKRQHLIAACVRFARQSSEGETGHGNEPSPAILLEDSGGSAEALKDLDEYLAILFPLAEDDRPGDTLVCPECDGGGTVLGHGADRYGNQNEYPCHTCEGEGEIPHPGPCEECDGHKVLVCDKDPDDWTTCPTCEGQGYETPEAS
jgi:hypothetical protein